VARRVASRAEAALPRRQSTPPCPTTVAVHIHSVWGFAKFAQNLNWTQNFAKTKVVHNFINYKTSFGDQSQFGVEQDEFDKTVWISNPNSRKFKFLNWGQTEFPKLLLILYNNLKNSQHESCSTFCALQLSC
jgi:hypothetical protein